MTLYPLYGYNGSVGLNYVDYELKNKDGDDFNATSFSQHYSVLNRQSGLLGAGRLGHWTLGLGAEWSAFDTQFDTRSGDKDVDGDSFKLLYEGDLLIAPGALPFRLNAFSHDLNHITKSTDESLLLPSTYLRPRLTTGLRNGQTIVSGLQLLAGIRNGSYLGKYRETFSTLPRLLIDYRDVFHRDVDAVNPSKFRQRDLAFVSLNKKDNWFHYRIYDYQDHIDSRQDSREETFLLGTVDHQLKRQWINMTNWIKLSVDGSYAMRDDKYLGSEEHIYTLNLFSIMDRRDINLTNFTNYQRKRVGNTVNQNLDVPLYLNNRISPDTNLRGQVVLNKWQEQFNGSVRDEEDIYYSTAKYETNITRRTKIDYGIEAEYNTRKRGDAQGLRAELEAYSNRLLRNRFSWYGNLGMGYFNGDALDGSDSDFWESFGAGRASYALMRNLTLQASQEFVYGTGSLGTYTTSYLVPRSSRGFNYTDGEVRREDDYFRSQTGLSLEHFGKTRLKNRVAAFYKYEEDGQSSNWSFELEHPLDYNKKSYNVQMTNFYSKGDVFNKNDFGNATLGASQMSSSPNELLKHITRIKYKPNKYWLSSLDLNVIRRNASASRGGDNTDILVSQLLRRNFYAINGVIRTLADVEQRIDYLKSTGSFSGERLTFTLAGNYYPTKILSFGGRFEYRYNEHSLDTMLFNVSTALTFPKFQVAFDYDYGTDDDRQIVVQRYEVNVRKNF